jgi:HK97 family phage prohead protease
MNQVHPAKRSKIKSLTLPVQKAKNRDGFVNVFIANSGEPDIIDDVLMAKGVDLTRYKANPVVSYMHTATYSADPNTVIAKGEVWEENDMLMLGIVKYDDNELAKEIKRKIDDGMLNTVSVSFMPKDGVYKTIGGKERFVITKSELLEVSVVNVPADPKAVKVKSIEPSPEIGDIEEKRAEVRAFLKVKSDEATAKQKSDAQRVGLQAYIEKKKI